MAGFGPKPQQASGGAAARDASRAPARLRDGVQRAERSALRPGRVMGASGRVGESSRSRLCHVACEEVGGQEAEKITKKFLAFFRRGVVQRSCARTQKVIRSKNSPGKAPNHQIGQLWHLPNVAAGEVGPRVDRNGSCGRVSGQISPQGVCGGVREDPEGRAVDWAEGGRVRRGPLFSALSAHLPAQTDLGVAPCVRTPRLRARSRPSCSGARALVHWTCVRKQDGRVGALTRERAREVGCGRVHADRRSRTPPGPPEAAIAGPRLPYEPTERMRAPVSSLVACAELWLHSAVL